MDYAGSSPSKHFRAMTPPVAGTVFAVTLAFMLLFPFVQLTLDGAGEPETLLFLTRTDFGLNIFALVLLLMPIAGVAVSLFVRERQALMLDALFAAVGVVMVPLVMLTLGHHTGRKRGARIARLAGRGGDLRHDNAARPRDKLRDRCFPEQALGLAPRTAAISAIDLAILLKL